MFTDFIKIYIFLFLFIHIIVRFIKNTFLIINQKDKKPKGLNICVTQIYKNN